MDPFTLFTQGQQGCRPSHRTLPATDLTCSSLALRLTLKYGASTTPPYSHGTTFVQYRSKIIRREDMDRLGLTIRPSINFTLREMKIVKKQIDRILIDGDMRKGLEERARRGVKTFSKVF